jgi:hypothetical protein
MDTKFNGVIFTNHALDRLRERNIKQGDAWATLSNPQSSREAQRKGSWVFYRTYGDRTIEVVASRSQKKEWIVLSVWDKPAVKGVRQFKKPTQSLFKRVLLELKSIFFR